MTRLSRAALAASCALLLVTPRMTHAQAPLILPATDYPALAHINVMPTADNAAYDCSIGLDCSLPAPLFHSGTSEDWSRLSGWMQEAKLHNKGLHRRMAWIIASNTCSAPDANQAAPWSEQMAVDFNQSVQGLGFQPATPPSVLPAGSTSVVSAWHDPNAQGWTAYALVTWVGDVEYEGVALAKGPGADSRMRAWLIKQFTDALAVPDTSASS